MKKKINILLSLCFLSITTYSQITFEKGYFIDNNDKKTTCFIENKDWRNTPLEFNYKLSLEGEVKKATVNDISEFVIGNEVSKYKRFTVKFDPSSDKVQNLSNTRELQLIEKKVFLKALVQGKANLYTLYYDSREKFFYNLNNSEIKFLGYKLYLKGATQIGKNITYKQELLTNLKCPKFSIQKLKKLEYDKKKLVNLFKDYNDCQGVEFTTYYKKQERDFIKFNIRPGINFSDLKTFLNTTDNNKLKKTTFRIGVELEYILPFNKNKWAIIIEPTYQYFKSEPEIDYTSIEVPFGFRYYSFLNLDSKIFLNAAYVVDFSFNSKIDYENRSELEIESGPNFTYGVGYKYKDTYSIEIRYQTKRDILNQYLYWNSDYQTTSIIFGYTLFNKKK